MLPKYYIGKILPIYSISYMGRILLIKAATLVFCTKCLEAQVTTSSMINQRKFSVLFLTARSSLTASIRAQYSDHSAIVQINRFMT